MSTTLLLIAAAFAAGLMNSVAGGGSFLSFPALVFSGVPPVMANATSTVAVSPASLAAAWAGRRDIPSLHGISTAVILLTSLLGGATGALLLIYTPEKTFNTVIPWLLLAATLLFAGGRRLTPLLRRYIQLGPVALCLVQFLIAVYGGYFGGAVGILMLALFGLFGLDDIHAMNALKNMLSGMLNLVAIGCFIAAGIVDWRPALMMLASSLVGGYVGGSTVRRMKPGHVRAVVIAIGVTMTAVFFLRG
jgi:uncharacterized protein